MGAPFLILAAFLSGVLTVAGAEPRVLARERRLLALHRIPRGPLFAAPLGAAFALGWTPCIGPVLAGLLAAAAASPTVAAGAGLLGVYTAGLAVPFLLLAWAVARGRGHCGGAAGLLGRHQPLLARGRDAAGRHGAGHARRL